MKTGIQHKLRSSRDLRAHSPPRLSFLAVRSVALVLVAAAVVLAALAVAAVLAALAAAVALAALAVAAVLAAAGFAFLSVMPLFRRRVPLVAVAVAAGSVAVAFPLSVPAAILFVVSVAFQLSPFARQLAFAAALALS